MIKIGVITMALVSFLHAGWFGDLFDFTPTPYHTIPIDLSKAGNVAETEIKIDEKYSIEILLDYGYRMQKNKMSSKDFKKIADKYFRCSEVCPKFPIKLKIVQLDNNKQIIIVDKLYIALENTSSSDKLVDEFHLEKGKYLIKLETVKDFLELKGLLVLVEIDYIRAK